MAFRIRQIDVTATGREIVRERVVDKARLTVGRAAENDIHLPDLALDPVHAQLRDAGAGRIAIEATGPLGFTLDGASTHAASILARNGGELGLGGTRITLSEEAGVPVLTVRAIAAAEGADESRHFSVASLLPGRRRTGWIAALLILGLLLALPIASHMSGGKVIGDSNWSPGKLSLGHHQLEGRCETCHVKGFVAVREETCRSCHKETHDHAAPTLLADARGQLPVGRALLNKVSAAFGRPGPGACSDCHVEHEGAGQMPPARQVFCADCHAGLQDNLTRTKLGNAADFGRLHPEFKVSFVDNADTRSRTRRSLAMHPREDNGLTFPHRLHLDAMGGAARMAVSLGASDGYGKPLTCAKCHHASDDGVRFKPIEMERDCGACHSLAYDRIGGTFRTLHHGDVAQAMADLSTYRGAVPITKRARPGAFGDGGIYHARFAAPPVQMSAFAKNGVCGTCHTAEMRGGSLAVQRVTLPTRYMDHGWFDHRAHSQSQCSECHAASGSNLSSDLLLPGIKTCRTCHAGEGSDGASDEPNKVASGCAMCHSYHPIEAVPRRAEKLADERKGG